jgi:hypothetical protein
MQLKCDNSETSRVTNLVRAEEVWDWNVSFFIFIMGFRFSRLKFLLYSWCFNKTFEACGLRGVDNTIWPVGTVYFGIGSFQRRDHGCPIVLVTKSFMYKVFCNSRSSVAPAVVSKRLQFKGLVHNASNPLTIGLAASSATLHFS